VTLVQRGAFDRVPTDASAGLAGSSNSAALDRESCRRLTPLASRLGSPIKRGTPQFRSPSCRRLPHWRMRSFSFQHPRRHPSDELFQSWVSSSCSLPPDSFNPKARISATRRTL
jgi:hypothetical protein